MDDDIYVDLKSIMYFNCYNSTTHWCIVVYADYKSCYLVNYY